MRKSVATTLKQTNEEAKRLRVSPNLEAAKAFLSTVGRHAASQAATNVREFARHAVFYGREHLRRFTGSGDVPHEVQQKVDVEVVGVKRRRFKVNL